MASLLRQSTAVEVKLGPFLDEDDGKTAETSLTIEDEHVDLAKNEGDWADKNETTTCVHESQGWYRCLLDTTDTNTAGILLVKVHVAGALPVWREFMVLPGPVYDALVNGTGNGVRADVQALAAGALTAIAAAVGGRVVEDAGSPTYSEDDLLRLMAAALLGKVSGLNVGAPEFRNLHDTLDRIVAVTDASGNRSSVALDPS